jgi:hypothetical protein
MYPCIRENYFLFMPGAVGRARFFRALVRLGLHTYVLWARFFCYVGTLGFWWAWTLGLAYLEKWPEAGS